MLSLLPLSVRVCECTCGRKRVSVWCMHMFFSIHGLIFLSIILNGKKKSKERDGFSQPLLSLHFIWNCVHKCGLQMMEASWKHIWDLHSHGGFLLPGVSRWWFNELISPQVNRLAANLKILCVNVKTRVSWVVGLGCRIWRDTHLQPC